MSSPIGKRKGRVLAVDDQPELFEGLKQMLELEGLEVFVHESLITLPLIVRDIDPDVILLDLSMPALSGAAAFKLGRHRVMPTDAPVILFSGRSRPELSALAEQLGADGFLSKTQEPSDIVRRIQMWIANRRALQSIKRIGEANVATSAPSPAAR